MEPAREQAGVDGAGDVGAGLHRADDGHVEDLGDVQGRQAALRLGHGGGSRRGAAWVVQDGCRGEGARSTHHRVRGPVAAFVEGARRIDPSGYERPVRREKSSRHPAASRLGIAMLALVDYDREGRLDPLGLVLEDLAAMTFDERSSGHDVGPRFCVNVTNSGDRLEEIDGDWPEP